MTEARADCGPDDRMRIRFPVTIQPDESLPGIIARSARDHVLSRTSPIMRAAGIEVYTPGAVIACDSSELERLADVLGQDCEPILVRAGDPKRRGIAFGDLNLPIGTLDLRTRRVGPISLMTSPHHRFSWMNRFLPCCPATGEFLIGSCSACGWELGWSGAAGIGTCEACKETIKASSEAPLTQSELPFFSLIANLMSFDPEVRERTQSALPETLRVFDCGTLAITGLQLAGLLRGTGGIGADIQHLRSRKPRELARIVSTAGKLVDSWPHSIRDALRAKLHDFKDDHDQFFRLWRTLKRISSPKIYGVAKSDMLLDGIPDLAGNIWKSFAENAATYTTEQTMKVLGVPTARIRALADIERVTLIEKPSRYRGNRQFLAGPIDDLRLIKDTSTTFATLTERMGIPTYGLEQLSATGLLEFRDDEAMAAAYGRRFVSDASVAALGAALESRRGRRSVPKDARPLHECARLLGGGEKPWILVIDALIRGELAHWGVPRRFNVRRTMVRPIEMRQFLGRRFEPAGSEFPFSPTYAKREAAEVLTIDTPMLDVWLDALGLDFVKKGRAKEIAKAEVLEVARAVVCNSELGEHWGIAPKKVRYDPRAKALVRQAHGWSRSDAVHAGLIQSI